MAHVSIRRFTYKRKPHLFKDGPLWLAYACQYPDGSDPVRLEGVGTTPELAWLRVECLMPPRQRSRRGIVIASAAAAAWSKHGA